MFISSAFAQTAPAAAAGGDMQSTLMSMLPLLLMFAVLYFVMIRPQMKKQKEHRAMIDALAKGDEVATAARCGLAQAGVGSGDHRHEPPPNNPPSGIAARMASMLNWGISLIASDAVRRESILPP